MNVCRHAASTVAQLDKSERWFATAQLATVSACLMTCWAVRSFTTSALASLAKPSTIGSSKTDAIGTVGS